MQSDDQQPEQHDGDPPFPLELECCIFQTAAKASPSTALYLMTISKRVYKWVLPILYETVTLANANVCQHFLRAVESKEASFFTLNVKSLCIPGDIRPDDAKRVLEVCQGLENLAYWIITCPPPVPFSYISTLQPRRLSFNTYGLFRQTSPPDFSHPFFSRVTHLEVVDWPWPDHPPHESRFELLPRLTHLALDIDRYEQEIATGLRHILATCRELLVLLCLVRDDYALFDATCALAGIGDEDNRLVILSDSEVLENWEASIHDTPDACQWICAEEIIAVREKQMRVAHVLSGTELDGPSMTEQIDLPLTEQMGPPLPQQVDFLFPEQMELPFPEQMDFLSEKTDAPPTGGPSIDALPTDAPPAYGSPTAGPSANGPSTAGPSANGPPTAGPSMAFSTIPRRSRKARSKITLKKSIHD